MNKLSEELTTHDNFSEMYTNSSRHVYDTYCFIDGMIFALFMTEQITFSEKINLDIRNRNLYDQYKNSDKDE